jgi:hypothetical protein
MPKLFFPLLYSGMALVLASAVHAQAGQVPEAHARAWLAPLFTIGNEVDERLRTEQLHGRATTAGYLIRSPSLLTPPLSGGPTRLRAALLAPELRTVWNSAIPLSQNDGAMWAGRGLSAHLLTGVRVAYGPWSLTLAPELSYTQNLDFATIPLVDEQRQFVPPWQSGIHSVDLPLRFGDRSATELHPGQSTLALDLKSVVVGGSTENQWWGPGIRNALVMSNNAPGIPHLFVRTGAPLLTRVGAFEAKWMLGQLSQSDQFPATGDGSRSLSAFALTYQPGREPDLTLGFARAVYSPLNGSAFDFGRFFDVFLKGSTLEDPSASRAREVEQIVSLFGRWIFPRDGFELYAEWGRTAFPTSLRDLLVEPNHSQGYTLGAQWATPLGRSGGLLRLQGEMTHLEQSPTLRRRPVGSWYASPTVVQGYTHRGQVIGAAIGPGSSGQWAAADYLTPAWSLGLIGGRTRWANDAFYDRPSDLPGSEGRIPNLTNMAHDVSVFAGARAGYRLPTAWISSELLLGYRLNYLWQNFGVSWETSTAAVDIPQFTLRLGVAPALPRQR